MKNFLEKGVVKVVTDQSGHYRMQLNSVEKNILNELNRRHYFILDNSKENINFKSDF